MSNYALVLTLGHNASAIVIKNGEILGGYEEERFTQIKSDSSFPIKSIVRLREDFDLPEDTAVCISHWFVDLNIQHESKYFSMDIISQFFPKSVVMSLSDSFDHHDAHMKAAEVFAGKDWADDFHTIVADGFGTYGECISVYHNGELISRVFGFDKSLGMFYQYATAACGMKMHNHEYKMLAYETRITNVPGLDIDDVNKYIDDFSFSQIQKIVKLSIDPGMDPIVSMTALPDTCEWVERILIDFAAEFGYDSSDQLNFRILVSYFSQRYVENVMRWLHSQYDIKNLLLSGGVFLNVKLNSMMCDMTPGKTCVYPLAGDQGAGLGVYQHYFGDLKWPDHLFWGHRNLDYDYLDSMKGVEVHDSVMTANKSIKTELHRIGFVNLVRGSMEFGPRALCNTSTLAIPQPEIAEMINFMNNRTNEMPFALVMTRKQYGHIFKDTDKVHKSCEYMIMTREFNVNVSQLIGGAHFYPLLGKWTCRPQITDDPMMIELCEEFGPLINTSWNFHGVPIVFDTDQLEFTHNREIMALPQVEFKTIVIRGD